MATQLHFFDIKNPSKNTDKLCRQRIRYAIPTYKKCYSVYAYDRDKYMDICNKLHVLAKKNNNPDIFFKVNPYSILRHCYLRDNNDKLKHIGDEKHIYRYKALNNIRIQLADFVMTPLFRDGEIYDDNSGLVVWFDDKDQPEAEIKGISRLVCDGTLNIKQQVLIHLHLLRLLRRNISLRDAVKLAWAYLDKKCPIKAKL